MLQQLGEHKPYGWKKKNVMSMSIKPFVKIKFSEKSII